jgi:O-antigen/teichoic acid export membrane protein
MAIKLIDVLVLGKYVALSLTGIYAIAAFVPTFIEAPLNALDKIANARIAFAWEKKDIENIRDIYFKSARYLFLIGGLLFLLVTLNAPHLFRLLPSIYMQGIPVISILSLGALFNLITGSNSAIIFTSEKSNSIALAIIAVALVNFMLLLLLIPIYGLEGAAWATCISSLAFNLFKYLFIYFRFGLQPFDKRTLFIGLSVLVTYGAVNLLPVIGNVFIDISLVTFLILLLYGIFIWYSRSADDLKDIIPFFKKSS